MNMNMRPPWPATLAMREDSHSISKPKPKIRIVHIFAPEIIKTDAANFRELVQRLTGKPAKRSSNKKARQVARSEHEAKRWRSLVKGELEEEEEKERGMWRRVEENSSSGGYLSGLGDVDGFLQGFSDFPTFPLGSSSHMDHMIGVGEAQVI